MDTCMRLIIILVLIHGSISDDVKHCVTFEATEKTCKIEVNCQGLPTGISKEIDDHIVSCKHHDSKIEIAAYLKLDLGSNDINKQNSLSNNVYQYIKEIVIRNGRLDEALKLFYPLDEKDNEKNFNGYFPLHRIAKNNIKNMDFSNTMILHLEKPQSEFDFEYTLEDLNLSHNMIETIPDQYFKAFRNLKVLDLSYNKIKGTVSIIQFQGLINLRVLRLSHNEIVSVDTALMKFEHLEELHLGHNNITNIPENAFYVLTKLRALNIADNRIKVIYDNTFEYLTNLETLDISNNKIEKISNKILSKNFKLSELLISNNNISLIEPKSFKNNQIKILKIDNNPLGSIIDTEIFDGLLITELDLSNMQIMSVMGNGFSTLSNTLTRLNLGDNLIKQISKNVFKNLKKLEVLNLSNNQLINLEFDSIDLGKLEYFNISSNNLTRVNVDTFKNLVSLIDLNLSHNQINDIEPSSFHKLQHLKYLNLANNNFGKVTTSTFKGLVNIQIINISYSNIKLIEKKSLSRMDKLEKLYCSHNQLANVDKDIFTETVALEVLDLSYNNIHESPINSIYMTRLKELYLNNNNLSDIGETMNMISLQKINFAKNNILNLKSNIFSSNSNLTFVDLSNNQNLEINIHFENLPHLDNIKLHRIKNVNFKNVKNTKIKSLIISSCGISNLDLVQINNIKNLETLSLKHNFISVLNENVFAGMSSLKTLDLSENVINEVKGKLFSDNKLEVLDLNNNKLVSLGTLTHGLDKLKYLDLSENQISNINIADMSELKNLETLNLSTNQLGSLHHKTFSNLINIKLINISNNQILDFGPWYLPNSKNKIELILDHNVISDFKFLDFAYYTNILSLSIGNNPIDCKKLEEAFKMKKTYTIKSLNKEETSNNVFGISCIKKIIDINPNPKITTNSIHHDNNANIDHNIAEDRVHNGKIIKLNNKELSTPESVTKSKLDSSLIHKLSNVKQSDTTSNTERPSTNINKVEKKFLTSIMSILTSVDRSLNTSNDHIVNKINEIKEIQDKQKADFTQHENMELHQYKSIKSALVVMAIFLGFISLVVAVKCVCKITKTRNV